MTTFSSTWKPKPWIAAILGFVLSPIGMLYVVRAKWAGVYLALFIFLASIHFILSKAGIELQAYFSLLDWIVALTCSVHAYRVARLGPTITIRPWYSRWYVVTVVPVFL